MARPHHLHRPTEPESDTNVVGYLVPPMLVLMVLVVVGTAVASRRRSRGGRQFLVVDDIDDASVAPEAADSLARAAEVGLAEIGDLSREPREAIIACYAAMERELTRVPGAVPQDFDTPSEVLARAVDNHALRADSATELVELFEEARFSPHVMTEAHRDAAMRVLEQVLAELPQDAATRCRMKKFVAAAFLLVVGAELIALAAPDRRMVLVMSGVARRHCACLACAGIWCGRPTPTPRSRPPMTPRSRCAAGCPAPRR